MGWLVMVGALALGVAVVVAVGLYRQRPDWQLHHLHELRALLQHSCDLVTQTRINPSDYQQLMSQTRQLHHLAPQAQKPMYRLLFHHLHALPQYDEVTQARMKNRALQHIIYLVDEAVPPVLIAHDDEVSLSHYQQVWYAVLELLQARQRFSYASIQLHKATPNASQSLRLQQQLLAKRLCQLQRLNIGEMLSSEIAHLVAQLDTTAERSLATEKPLADETPLASRLALSQQVNAVMLTVLDNFLADLLARFPAPQDDIFNTLSPLNEPRNSA
ncbi:hypothetical protein [Salinivibrio socompensis]|uniref:hypothetical protein n=1 Tax=Salinivibrio socompensis TaxID=1510206 RepID=UPI0004710EF4|nr:hypothetical protein [Salinivibrio socompensis]